MSKDLYENQRAAHDALDGIPNGAKVRLPRGGQPHAGTLSRGATIEVDGTTHRYARVRFTGVHRNQWVTLTTRHLATLEVKRGARYAPFYPYGPEAPR